MQAERVRPEGLWDGLAQVPVEKPGRMPAQNMAHGETVVIRGRAEILELRPMLIELAAMSGLAGSADDFDYFMSLPATVRRTPYLILHRAKDGEPSVWGFCGATLLFEFPGLLGGSRVFSTTDDTGRRNVLAPRTMRARVAAHAVRTMMRRGAHVVLVNFSLHDDGVAYEVEPEKEFLRGAERGRRRWRSFGSSKALWACSEQTLATHMPLQPSYEDTLAGMSHKMRFNLGYYRRRAERELGCRFVPAAEISEPEFMELKRASMYAVPDSLAEWRYHSLKRISNPLLCGVKDGEGRWLSLLGGRRQERSVEIDWVMNRDGLGRFSLGTVVRSYLMEHECQRGAERLYVEGGTLHGTGRWFVKERVLELTVKRRSLYVWLLTRFAAHLLVKHHAVPRVLRDPGSRWQRW